MPSSSSLSKNLSRPGEYIHHITGVRMRLNGSGSLQMRLVGLDDVNEFEMLPLEIQVAPGIEPTRLANFRSQRTQLELKTTEINEWFRISRILIYTRTSATSYPGIE